MCNWGMKVADACEIILDMMRKDILANAMINIDETPLQVLKGPRKSKDVTKAAGKNSGKSGNAGTALKYINKLYKIEKDAREQELTAEQLYDRRQSLAVPVLDEIKKWLDARVGTLPPKSLLGKAINYTLGQWHRLKRYTENGIIRPDNNLVENAIRPFVVGRKNWLFSHTPQGAHASAAVYSLIETAKASGLDPYWYLKCLFKNLPEAMSENEFKALLPYNIEKKLFGGPATS